MRGLSTVHYIGTVAKEPELKYTVGGLAILELTVAGKEEAVGADGAPKTLTFYHRCKCFGTYAEALANHVQQGDVVSVQGRLEYRAWDNEEGEKRSTVETVVETLQTLSGEFVTEDDRRGQPILLGALNLVSLGGNLTRDAELKELSTGSSVTKFSVAVNERSGKGDEKVGYFELQAWGELAQVLAAGSKGQDVIGFGRLLNDTWEDKDGNKRYSSKIELGRAHFVASGGRPAVAQTKVAEPRAAPLNADEEFPAAEELPF